MIRILLVEDDHERVIAIRSWLPADIRLVHAGSAGRAIGILKRDRDAYAGIMLDHDLREQIVTERDFFLSGSTVVKTIISGISPATPILVHSMNPGCAPLLVKVLEKSGFCVTRLPMREMTRESFNDWLGEVRESWEDRR